MNRPRALSHARRRTCCLWFAASLIVMPEPSRVAAIPIPDQGAAEAMERFLGSTTTVRQYSAYRRLEASGRGHGAWMDVQTDFTVTSGLLYQVTAEGGSPYIRARVLRSLLDEEQRVIARTSGADIALSTENYQFTPERIDEHGLAVVRMQPLRRDRSLIAGRLFLTPDGDLLRVEGRLAKNPSFWVTRVDVVRSYRRINGVLMPVSLDTTAQLRLLGPSALRMTYHYSHVDDQVVDDPGAGAMATESRAEPSPRSSNCLAHPCVRE